MIFHGQKYLVLRLSRERLCILLLGIKSMSARRSNRARADLLSYDFKNKRVGVVGGGSSYIQIVHSLQNIEGAQLTCFLRS